MSKGFSLLEVIIAILIFSIFIVSVFHTYSGFINSSSKFEEKYVILRLAREFVDNFNDENSEGKEEKEAYILEWQSYPIEGQRKISSGQQVGSFLQLKLIHLDIISKESKKKVFTTNFVSNEYSTVKKD
jgi:prepilin-type N-terminal cleavage/methylation domain-containing protein